MLHSYKPDPFTIKNALGGYVIQDRDTDVADVLLSEIVTKIKPTSEQYRAINLGLRLS